MLGRNDDEHGCLNLLMPQQYIIMAMVEVKDESDDEREI